MSLYVQNIVDICSRVLFCLCMILLFFVVVVVVVVVVFVICNDMQILS